MSIVPELKKALQVLRDTGYGTTASELERAMASHGLTGGAQTAPIPVVEPPQPQEPTHCVLVYRVWEKIGEWKVKTYTYLYEAGVVALTQLKASKAAHGPMFIDHQIIPIHMPDVKPLFEET